MSNWTVKDMPERDRQAIVDYARRHDMRVAEAACEAIWLLIERERGTTVFPPSGAAQEPAEPAPAVIALPAPVDPLTGLLEAIQVLREPVGQNTRLVRLARAAVCARLESLAG